MSTMLSPGRYKAENNDNFLSQYSIVMEVKETEKSYIFQLVELNSRYSAGHIKHLFARSKRVIIRKNCGGHAPDLVPVKVDGITPELEHRKSGYVERKRRPCQGNVARIA